MDGLRSDHTPVRHGRCRQKSRHYGVKCVVVRPAYILQIARFTLQEAISRRLILAGVVISLGYIGLFALGFHFAYDKALENSASTEARLSLGLAFATLTLFGVYVVNYLASFLALFLSVGAISGEIDSGTLHAVLARPLKRSEFVIGRWLGYAVMICVYIVAMTGLPVQIENSARACALAQLWLERGDSRTHSFAYVTVSDGVGVGVVINGELLRGNDYLAGEFGHLPLNIDGPRCMCGAKGCWEAYTSNLAILSRYFGWDLSELSPKVLRDSEKHPFSILELIERARAGDAKAIGALETSARFLGIGLANIVKTINPDCIYLSGEIMTGWDMIESVVRKGLSERALTEAGARTPLRLTPTQDYPRLKGAAALIAAPTFAAPRVA